MSWHRKYQSSSRTSSTKMRTGGESGTFIYVYSGASSDKCYVWNGNTYPMTIGVDYPTNTGITTSESSTYGKNNWSSLTQITTRPSSTTAIPSTDYSGTIYYANINDSRNQTGGCNGIWAWHLNANGSYACLDKWESDYTLSYSANGGSGAPSSVTITYNYGYTLSSTTPTKTNSTFLGWSTSSTATTATYTAGQNLTYSQVNSLVSGVSQGGTKTLYAVWQSSTTTYTVTGGPRPAEGGSVTGTGTYPAGSNVTLTATPNSGYTFDRWYINGQSYITTSNPLLINSINSNYQCIAQFISTEPEYTLTIQYHLNGGTIADRVHRQSSTSSNYWTYKEDNLIYKCTDGNGSNPTLWTHSFTCKPSKSSSTSVNLTDVSSFGITREGCSVPSGTTAWRSGPRSGTVISQDNTTVYAVLGNQNLTYDRTLTVYVNWNASTYALDIQYDLNGGALTSTVTSYTNSSTGVTTYFKARSDGLLCECNSSGNQMVPLRTHLEYSSYNAVRNLWNISSYDAQKTGYITETAKEYKTSSGTLINQDTQSSSDTNPATVQRMSGTTTYADRVVTLLINWVSSSGSKIYVKTSDGWVQGTPYVKTSDGWVQGTVYVKTSDGWVQST